MIDLVGSVKYFCKIMSELALNKSLDYLKNLKLGDASYNSKVQALYMKIYTCKDLIIEIENFADEYTFDQHQRDCGFRSTIKVFMSAVNDALSDCTQPKWHWRVLYSKKMQIELVENYLTIHFYLRKCIIAETFKFIAIFWITS